MCYKRIRIIYEDHYFNATAEMQQIAQKDYIENVILQLSNYENSRNASAFRAQLMLM